MYRTFGNRTTDFQRQFNRLQNEVSRLISNTASPAFPLLNIWLDEENIFVEAELPGVNSEDLDIKVSEGVLLTISGERSKSEQETSEYHRRERVSGKFTRTVKLPEEIDPDAVEATLHNGVLEVKLAKRVENRPRSIQVNVK